MVRYIALLPGHDQRGLFLQKVNKQADGASSFSPRSRFVSDSFEMHIDISSIVILPFKEKKRFSAVLPILLKEQYHRS